MLGQPFSLVGSVLATEHVICADIDHAVSDLSCVNRSCVNRSCVNRSCVNRSCVNREVGLGSHFPSQSSPDSNKPMDVKHHERTKKRSELLLYTQTV